MHGEHDDILARIEDYVHGVLTPEAAARVERHCETCADCRAEMEAAERRLRDYLSLPPVEASEALIQDTLERVGRDDRLRRWRRRYGFTSLLAAAASVLLLIGVQVHFSRLSAGDFDLRVLGQDELLAGSNASLRVQVFDRKTGEAVGGVPVVVELKGRGDHAVQLASFTTDANGTGRPRFDVPDWDETCELRVSADLPNPGPQSTTTRPVQETVIRQIQVKRSWKLMLSTDKPVYQPGQTIKVRALAMRQPTRKPAADEFLVFAITDAKGNIIFKSEQKTSPYGIAACDCPLATEVIEGHYAITCKVGDTESRQTVDVKKYVLPKFKVDIELDRPFYHPNERVNGTVKAAYFFGKPVANAAVTVEVEGPRPAPRETAAKVEVRTNEQGAATFNLPVPSLWTRGGDGSARFAVRATVRDAAEQTQQRTVIRTVSESPMHIEVLPEGGTLVAGVPNTIYLYARYADGRPVPFARFERLGLQEAIVANELGVAVLQVTPNQEAHWDVRVTDQQGVNVVQEVRLPIGQGDSNFLVRTDRAVYDTGDTMHLEVQGGGPGTIYLDLLRDGQTLLTDTIEPKDGKGAYAVDLPPEWAGALELVAYRFNRQGLPVRQARVIYVRPARELRVSAKADREEYRPGKQAALRFALTDPAGKPVQGALSLAAVDEAVFSVREQMPGMERTFFTLEKELLQPVYTVYPSWSPDFRPDLPREQVNRFEQAVFASTAGPSTYARPRGGQAAEMAPDVGSAVMDGRTHRLNRNQKLHSLSASSFEVKQQVIDNRKNDAENMVTLGWVLVVAASLVALYAYLWMAWPARTMLLLTAAGSVLASCPVAFLFLLMNVGGCGEKFANEMPAGAAPTADARPEEGMVFFEQRPAGALRVRDQFPETLLWQPQLITDANGEATLDLPLADSITTWRLSASAVTATGQLGATQSEIKVFQPFFVDLNLPVSLTRGDEVSVPVVVYNYLAKPQTVELKLEGAGWFERQGGDTQRLELGAKEIRSTTYRIRATRAGVHSLQVSARGEGVGDALKRTIEVVPDGRRVEQVASDRLGAEVRHAFTIPANAVPDSSKILVKIYPGVYSQVIEGVDGMLQMPHGCFEQTSSSAYPNLLVVDYLRRTHRGSPETLAKAEQYLQVGYQRLLTFENSGGGFDWWGKGPPVVWLTAYGLMEFHDMKKVYAVDPSVITRTQHWLLQRQAGDGTWSQIGPTHGEAIEHADDAKLALTTYVAWALAESGAKDSRLEKAIDYIRRHAPQSRNPYNLALAANALAAFDAEHASTREVLGKLQEFRQNAAGDAICFPAPGEQSLSYAREDYLTVETTALAVLALLKTGGHADTINRSLAYLIHAKQPQGTWGSTSATVLSLKALVRGLEGDAGKGKTGRFTVLLNGKEAAKGEVTEFNADVMRLIDLAELTKPGRNEVVIRSEGSLGMMYQVVARHHEAWASGPAPKSDFDLRVDYERTEISLAEHLQASATLRHTGRARADMVMVDLGVPPGFRADPADFEPLVARGDIARYSITPRQITLYLSSVEAGSTHTFRYRLTPLFPVKAQTRPSIAYEYYTPSNRATAAPVAVTVTR